MEYIVNNIVIVLQIVIPLLMLIGVACITLMISIKLGDLQDFIRRMER